MDEDKENVCIYIYPKAGKTANVYGILVASRESLSSLVSLSVSSQRGIMFMLNGTK